MEFLTSTVNAIFYVSIAALAIICTMVANSMTETTCRCIRACLIMIILGLFCLTCAVFYGQVRLLGVLLVLPTLWGIAGWLVFDRYRAHDDIDRLLASIGFNRNRLTR